MTEKYQPIPHRLKNMAVGGHVAGAEDIIDDVIGNNQQQINNNTYRKNETYNTEEIGEIISRTPETDVAVLAVEEGETALDVLNEVPLEDRPNKLFRVKNDDNTAYGEYGWTGERWALLASKDYGIDEAPTEGSANWLTSDAIYKYIENLVNSNLEDYKFAVTDKYGNVICLVNNQDKLKVLLDIVANTINGIPTAKIVSNEVYKIAFVDNNDDIFFGIKKNNKIYSPLFDTGILYGTSDAYLKASSATIYKRHQNFEPILLNDCLYDYNPSYNQGQDFNQNTLRTKRIQFAVVTDTHKMIDTFQNGVDAATGFVSIDATLQLGDMCNWVNPGEDTYISTEEIINSATKPLFITPGNHDIGPRTQYVKYCKDNVQLYNRFVKPAVDKGWLKPANADYTYKKDGEDVSFPKVAEYQENKVYYYHDFDEFKVRLIMLYPNDDGDASLEIDDNITDETSIFDRTYWKPVEYDEEYESLTKKQYYIGDKVNVEGYDTYSFECTQNVQVTLVTKSMGSQDEAFNKNPRFKALRRMQWYGQEQIDWLCDRLEEAGEHDYICIIGQHYRFINIDSFADITTRFQNPYKTGGSIYEDRYVNDDDDKEENPNKYKNIISQIVNAYQNKGTISITLHAKTQTYKGAAGGYDDCSAISDVVVNKTFTHSGKVLFVHGHNHSDAIFKSNRYDQTDIGFICGTLFEVDPIDVNRENTVEGRDLVTCITVYKQYNAETEKDDGIVHISRIGNNLTNRIDENTHTLIKKDNEIIKF